MHLHPCPAEADIRLVTLHLEVIDMKWRTQREQSFHSFFSEDPSPQGRSLLRAAVYLLSDVVLVDGVLKGKVKFAARQGWIVVIIIQEPCISPSEQSHLYVFAEFSVKNVPCVNTSWGIVVTYNPAHQFVLFGNHKILIRFLPGHQAHPYRNISILSVAESEIEQVFQTWYPFGVGWWSKCNQIHLWNGGRGDGGRLDRSQLMPLW